MVVESIQSSFKWSKNKISFYFLCKQKIAIWTFKKEQEKHLNLITFISKYENLIVEVLHLRIRKELLDHKKGYSNSVKCVVKYL